jgi:hypothetical protein
MVLPKTKKEKIRKFLEDGKTWEYIRNKTGVSNDAINNIRRESPYSPNSTASHADKTQRVIQDHTNQIQQPPTTKNTPDLHVLYLEHKINNVDQGLRANNQQLLDIEEILHQFKQSQQPQETKEPLQEKPDDQPNLHELTHEEIQTKSLPSTTTRVQLPKKYPDQIDALLREIKINPPPSPDLDIPETPKTGQSQTVTAPENQENENRVISSYRNAVIFREGVKAISFFIKLGRDYSNYKKTGFFPHADYLKYVKKTNTEKKTKKSIISDELKQSLIVNSNPPLYLETNTNERLKNLNKYLDNPGIHLIAIGYGKGFGIVISPALQKYIQQS